MILRNFANDEGGLSFWRRQFATGEVKRTTPENLFLEDNYYTLVGDNGERDVSIEEGFAKLDALAARLISDLLRIVRSGRRPNLSERAWELFALFHYYSGKRSAAWHSRFVSREEVMALTNEISEQPEWMGRDEVLTVDDPDLDRVMNNARIAAQWSPPPEDLLALMRSRGMAMYIAPLGASFILGDHPAAMAYVGDVAGARAGQVSFMPIAFDVAIGYFVRPGTVHVHHLTRPQIRAMNEAMARQSNMIAGRSDALIRSLSKLRYETPDYFTTLGYLIGE